MANGAEKADGRCCYVAIHHLYPNYTVSDGQTKWINLYDKDIIFSASGCCFRSYFQECNVNLAGRGSRKSYTWILSGVRRLCFTTTCVSPLICLATLATCRRVLHAQSSSRHHHRRRPFPFLLLLLFVVCHFLLLPPTFHNIHVHRIESTVVSSSPPSCHKVLRVISQHHHRHGRQYKYLLHRLPTNSK